MKLRRRHHPHLSRLLAPYVGGESAAQALLSLYVLRSGWSYEDWLAYREQLALTLRALLRQRAVQRPREGIEDKISPTPTLPLAPRRSGLTEALRASEEER